MQPHDQKYCHSLSVCILDLDLVRVSRGVKRICGPYLKEHRTHCESRGLREQRAIPSCDNTVFSSSIARHYMVTLTSSGLLGESATESHTSISITTLYNECYNVCSENGTIYCALQANRCTYVRSSVDQRDSATLTCTQMRQSVITGIFQATQRCRMKTIIVGNYFHRWEWHYPCHFVSSRTERNPLRPLRVVSSLSQVYDGYTVQFQDSAISSYCRSSGLQTLSQLRFLFVNFLSNAISKMFPSVRRLSTPVCQRCPL